MPDLVHEETKLNIDSSCNYDEGSDMFIGESRKDFFDFFNQICKDQSSCIIDPENMKYKKDDGTEVTKKFS